MKQLTEQEKKELSKQADAKKLEAIRLRKEAAKTDTEVAEIEKKLGRNPDRKFIMLIPVELDLYADWWGRENKRSKAEFYRELGMNAMRADRDYRDYLKK